MISCLPDKFAGEVCKFVEIDFQVESKAEENLPRYETVVESEDFQVALFFYVAQRHSKYLPISVFVTCVF